MTIHCGWVFSDDETQCAHDNMAHLKSLDLKYGEDYVVEVSPGFAHYSYTLTAKSDKARKLTELEAALVVDSGDLCFGGRHFIKNGDTYTGIIHTD